MALIREVGPSHVNIEINFDLPHMFNLLSTFVTQHSKSVSENKEGIQEILDVCS